MLGNLNNFFIFINWFHYTHIKMFDVYITILHMHQTVEHWRSPGRFVVEFWVFIDWSHPNIPHTHTHTPRRSTLTPWFFVSVFWVCCRVWGFNRLITSQHSTHTFFVSEFPGDQFFVSEFRRDHFSGDHSSPGPFFRGSFLPGSIFPGFG